MSGKACDKCGQGFKGFGTTCSRCRKGGKNAAAPPKDCDKCGNFFVGFGSVCQDCINGKGLGRTGVRAPTADEVDAVLDKIGICIMKVDTSQTSMVKLRQAEINLLGQLETIRDLMDRIFKSGDRILLRSTFIDCGRMSRLVAFLSQCHFSEMNAKDQRFSSCKKSCAALKEKVIADLDIDEQVQEAENQADRDLLRARLSIVMDASKVVELRNLAMPDEVDPYAGRAQLDDEEAWCSAMESAEEDEEDEEEDAVEKRFKAKAKDLFDKLDVDGDGNLTQDEVKNEVASSGLSDMLKECKIYKQPKNPTGKGALLALQGHVLKMFKSGDIDGDGSLDFEEFFTYINNARERAMQAMPKKIDDAMVKMVFQTMDKDGDGSITCEELSFAYAGILLKAGESVSPKRVNKWAKRNFKKYDMDDSNALDLKEFSEMLMNSPDLKPLLATIGNV